MTREAGFTLVEILVALAILGLGLGALTQMVPLGVRTGRTAEAQLAALAIAQSQLAAAGVTIPLVPGELQGASAGGYSWRLTISPITDPRPIVDGEPVGEAPAAASGTGPDAAPAIIAFMVACEVVWERDGRVGRLLLPAVRLAASDAPWSF